MFFVMARFLQIDRCDDMAVEVRIRIVSYEGNIYYTKMVNGEIEVLKELGAGR